MRHVVIPLVIKPAPFRSVIGAAIVEPDINGCPVITALVEVHPN